MRVIGINDDRIHRNVRQIAALVRPDERATIRSTGYLEQVARRARCVGVKAANSRIANRHVHRWHGWIEGDAKDRTVRQNAVTTGHVHPVPLGGDSGAKVETNLHVTIVRPDDGDALILRRVLDLIDERAVAQRSLGQARICAGTRRGCSRVPSGRRHGGSRTENCLPYPGCAGNQVPAASCKTGRRTVVAAGYAAMEHINRQDE